MTSNLSLPFDEQDTARESRIDAGDQSARDRAVDPRFNVALEASAGTGKTRVLVDRYINLLRAGIDPSNILAITFTRKAAAEMRERILTTLRTAAERGEITPARWRELRDRLPDIAISTIDAFCLSLLREFPLEADLDPGFSMAEETEIPRLIEESLDRALRTCRSVAREDENVALVFAQLGDRRARAGLAALLSRRTVAPAVLSKYLAKGPRDWDVASVALRGAAALLGVFAGMRGGLDAFIETGPLEPSFVLLARDLRALDSKVQEGLAAEAPLVQTAFARAREHFLTQDGEPRSRLAHAKPAFASNIDWQRHKDLVIPHAEAIRAAYRSYRQDLNVLVSRGVWRMFRIAETEYRRTLDAHATLDFSDVLLRALGLLRQMEEFAQSRYRLESRYHHVLVDEFQDTSRAQWELVSLLIRSWGEGIGLAHGGPLEPSIFIVGDRKQSIYGFRDADASILDEAGSYLTGIRPGGDVRRSISRSFRAVPPLLRFVNDLCADIDKMPQRRDRFRYDEQDRFPVDDAPMIVHESLGLLVDETPEGCAEAVAAEIARLLGQGSEPAADIRDRDTGVRRPARAGDVAILFRTRESHREFEQALERHGVLSYVYKGLGFFDADEIKDVLALFWYLADPQSDLRAAAWLRSRFVRLSDEGLRRLAPRLAASLEPSLVSGLSSLDPPKTNDQRLETDLSASDARALVAARDASARWRALVDRMPPAELLDVILHESAYAWEMRGARFQQARENLKKFRALVRRIQNRGYTTLGRIANHLDRLAVGDEANAAIDASDAVSLMTVHAAKGLEFPVVFVVNLARGTGNRRDAIRIGTDSSGDAATVSVGDFLSEFDEDEPDRDREETKRLLYVALTRARDRLYLSSVLKDGRLQPGRGSLAEILPPTLAEQFGAALSQPGKVQWRAASGAEHNLMVPPRPEVPGFSSVPDAAKAACYVLPEVAPSFSSVSPGDDLAPLNDKAASHASRAFAETGTLPQAAEAAGAESDRLVGRLVHRLLQRFGLNNDPGLDRLHMTASMLLRPEEAADLPDRDSVLRKAATTFQRVRERPGLPDLYASGKAFHELPFVMEADGVFVRGTIDCLIQTDRQVLIFEFKTGRPRQEHQAQAETYRMAAMRIFPAAEVVVQLIYVD